MTAETKRCTRCILSANFPRIEFDEHGVCNFCRDKLLFSTEKEKIKEAEAEILKMFDRERGKSEYDAIVCYSGGKDSTMTLKLAVEKYNLRVLAFTLENHFTSPGALDNIRRVVAKLGVDHITFSPSKKFMAGLYRASTLYELFHKNTLTRISANCNSCISVVNNTALKYALEKEVPFIIAGFTLGQIPLNGIYYKNNYSFLKESRQAINDKLKKHEGPEVAQYLEISQRLEAKTTSYPTNVNILCLETFTEEEIVENILPLGWVPPKDVDGCSSNCQTNSFNNYVHEKRFGYSPYELELSHLIRNNLLTREEAIRKLADQPIENIRKAFSELRIDEKQLAETGYATIKE
jgi:PP-loop superfamily ATP-utilizing enzyme